MNKILYGFGRLFSFILAIIILAITGVLIASGILVAIMVFVTIKQHLQNINFDWDYILGWVYTILAGCILFGSLFSSGWAWNRVRHPFNKQKMFNKPS